MSSNGSENSDVEESSVTHGFEPLKSAWETNVNNEYMTEVKLQSDNRGWKTSEEITDLLSKIQVRNAFEDAKSKREERIKRKYSTKEYAHLPKELKRLHKIAKNCGGYEYKRKKWRLVVDKDDGTDVLYKGSDINPSDAIADFHRMLPIDNSYDFLMKLHCEMDHVGPTAFADYLHVNKVGALPRKLVQQFHNYCVKCVKRNKEREARKVAKQKPNEVISTDFGLLAVSIVTFPCLDVEDQKVTFLFAMFMKTRYVICSRIKNDFDMSSYVAALMNELMKVGVPRKMHISNCTGDEKDEVRLLHQSLNLMEQCQTLIEQILNLNEQFYSNFAIDCQVVEGVV